MENENNETAQVNNQPEVAAEVPAPVPAPVVEPTPAPEVEQPTVPAEGEPVEAPAAPKRKSVKTKKGKTVKTPSKKEGKRGPSKAERVIAAIRRGHEGKTAAELAIPAKLDHNRIFFNKMVKDGILKRKGKPGRGCKFFKGRNFPLSKSEARAQKSSAPTVENAPVVNTETIQPEVTAEATV